jgi:hypothetical protein
MLNRIVAGFFLIFLGLTSAVFYTVALAIWVLTVLVDRRLIMLHLFTSFWASLYLWIMPAWSVHVDGRRQDAWKRNYMIVSNHQLLEPIPAEQFADLSVEDLTERVRTLVASQLEEMSPA